MSDYFLGEIRMFAGNFAMRGWAMCNGQLLSINQYTALFSLLGTTYGGDGRVNFALPDMRGRVPVSWGSGPGLTPRTMGENSGSEAVTLTLNEIPLHSHQFSVTNTDATISDVSNTVLPGKATKSATPELYADPGTSGTATTLDATAVTPTGGSQAHPNIMPSLVLTFNIALQGIFPSRN
jgi:microcystin-dependent protein